MSKRVVKLFALCFALILISATILCGCTDNNVDATVAATVADKEGDNIEKNDVGIFGEKSEDEKNDEAPEESRSEVTADIDNVDKGWVDGLY